MDNLKIEDCAIVASVVRQPLSGYSISANYIKSSPHGLEIGIELRDHFDASSFQAGAVLENQILHVGSLPYASPADSGRMDNPLLTADNYVDVPATFVTAFQKIAEETGCTEIRIPAAGHNPEQQTISDLARLAHESSRSSGKLALEIVGSLFRVYHDYDHLAKSAIRKVYDDTAKMLYFEKSDGYWTYKI